MTIYLGSDHGGFAHKQAILAHLQAAGREVVDCGSHRLEPADDYTDFSLAVAQAVAAQPGSRGILLCRSGEGMEMVANKVAGIRAALVWDRRIAQETRRDNDANVMVLPADFITSEQAVNLSDQFLETEFSGEERHLRRLEKLHQIEHTQYHQS